MPRLSNVCIVEIVASLPTVAHIDVGVVFVRHFKDKVALRAVSGFVVSVHAWISAILPARQRHLRVGAMRRVGIPAGTGRRKHIIGVAYTNDGRCFTALPFE